VKASEVLGCCRAVCEGLVRRGVHGIKNPLPVTRFRRGLQHTRRVETIPHGALTSEAAYPLQSSSLQGLLLHEDSCPTPWIFAPTNFNIVPPLPHLSRGLSRSRGSAPAMAGGAWQSVCSGIRLATREEKQRPCGKYGLE
jgi:hypothetical protein